MSDFSARLTTILSRAQSRVTWRKHMSKITDAQDILATACGCVRCISSAVCGPATDDGAIASVANVAADKINEAIELLTEYRISIGEGPPTEASP
jgi:hypothetical protein